MTTKKVDDLTLDELNEQVALCLGWIAGTSTLDGAACWYDNKGRWHSHYAPCHNSQQAFEIIEREKISSYYDAELDYWQSYNDYSTDNPIISSGNNPLISVMKCYVKSVKGEMVEL